ncbi:hypothetical protein [Streptomyces macrosporus]|uniref:Secreted protein n=1 Tax=Streptomyces macrosporus TaxID=44032 RepID=A0ABP5X325_9ACTN
MEFVIGLLALLFVLFTVLGAIAAVKTARAVKRGVERAGDQVRRTVEDTTLRARGAQPGPVGELARVRLELRASLDGTRRALEAGSSHDASLSEALGLFERLQEHARQLDGELRLLMEREPDRARVAARLPEARERAERIKASADSLRFAAQDRARRHSEDELAALSEQIELEAGALRHWVTPDAELPGASGAPGAPGVEGRTGTAGQRAVEPGSNFGTTDFGTTDFRKGRPQSAS